MKATNVNHSDMQSALATVNSLYDGNVIFNRFDAVRNGFNFTLRVKSSKAPGHKVSYMGRHITSACWHVHRDFMIALFDVQPDAVIKSHLAVYRGRGEFHRLYPDTGNQNIGSMVSPLSFQHACEC